MEINIAQFHQTFFEESFEGLDVMEANLLHLEVGTPEVEMINTIFRAIHSIKGGSGTFGFHDITALAHVMETWLDEMRDGRRQATHEAQDLLLQGVDCLRDLFIVARQGGESDAPRVARLQAQFERQLPGEQPGTSEPLSPSDASDGQDAITPGRWQILFRPHLHMLHTGNEPARMFRELETLGTLTVRVDTSGLPTFADLNPEDCYLGWELSLDGAISPQQVEEVFAWVEGDCALYITPLPAPEVVPPDNGTCAGASHGTTRRAWSTHPPGS